MEVFGEKSLVSTLKNNRRGVVIGKIRKSYLISYEDDASTELCSEESLHLIPSAESCLAHRQFSPSLNVISHFQALAINSVNNKWGVFGCANIDLLPHQLWVCRKVQGAVPCRMLVADDVGLGKTIEAGLIISSFKHQRADDSRRILIMTPASLVHQWQDRMKTMFDLRFDTYVSQEDRPNHDYWCGKDQVIASFHALRLDRKGRWDRLMSAEPWDLVIVDEAHHLNREHGESGTLGYQLVKELENVEKIKNMIFFTGTPHRGNNYGFLSLMQLLSPKFDPGLPLESQLDILSDYMIRNNKYCVTDLEGHRLFKPHQVIPTKFHFSPEEQAFYDMMTQFILDGHAYANTLSAFPQSAAKLVLTSMQKLASSSTAAIRQALSNRLQNLRDGASDKRRTKGLVEKVRENSEETEDADNLAVAEESLVEDTETIRLHAEEEKALTELLECADAIPYDTKIKTILNVIRTDYPNESILFFTEYKATQRLLLESLLQDYGEQSTTFINGDRELKNVHMPDGNVMTIAIDRHAAAEKFNNGDCRFLIATEAAGEGIDLQSHCHVLFHVDLPWNPMRVHQRVGRLNRYGQTQQVIVRNFRNPSTVESVIWDKLTTKIEEIQKAYGGVMEEQEDLSQLILGMTKPNEYTELFTGARLQSKKKDGFNSWWNQKTAKMGNSDAFLAAKQLLGNATKFNYGQASEIIPKTDLPNLQPFLKNILSLHHRNLSVTKSEDNGYDIFAFNTPENWQCIKIRAKYENYVLSRMHQHQQRILGVGDAFFDKALLEAIHLEESVCCCEKQGERFEGPLLIYAVYDIQNEDEARRPYYYGLVLTENLQIHKVLSDWELLLSLNEMKVLRDELPQDIVNCYLKLSEIQDKAEEAVLAYSNRELSKPADPLIVLTGIVFCHQGKLSKTDSN